MGWLFYPNYLVTYNLVKVVTPTQGKKLIGIHVSYQPVGLLGLVYRIKVGLLGLACAAVSCLIDRGGLLI